jgi:hypothetical protein
MMPNMTLKDHLETADDLAIAAHHLTRAFFRCQRHYCKTGRLMRLFWKLLPNTLTGTFSRLKCELDSDYHRLITDEQFKEHGHIYYSLEARYQTLMENSSVIIEPESTNQQRTFIRQRTG